MDELQELMAAAETIKKHCSENECSSCPFWQPRAINSFDDLARVCVLNYCDTPCDWKLTTESDEDREKKWAAERCRENQQQQRCTRQCSGCALNYFKEAAENDSF